MITAKSIMSENVITISESGSLAQAAKIIVSKNVRIVVVTKDKYPVGIIAQKDIIKSLLNKTSINVKVKNYIGKNFLSINPSTTYKFMVNKLREEKIGNFFVIEKNKLIGIVTETDLIESTRDFTRFHQITQEVILAIFGLVTAFFLFFFSPLGQSIKNSI